MSVDELSAFEIQLRSKARLVISRPIPIPLGRLVLPSIRWALRRHTLPDDEPTRYLLRQYILSAYHIAQEFSAFLHQVKPQTAVIFNGIMYPEATARWVARQMGVRTVAHEVGFQRFSAFFTEGEPTAYPIHIPQDFELDDRQNARLDAYLEKRFQGQFTMAGIQFWPEMRGLDAGLSGEGGAVPPDRAGLYQRGLRHQPGARQHGLPAHVRLAGCWCWSIIRSHPETLFVIRAHPDEMRPGTPSRAARACASGCRATVWTALPNVVFIDSQEYISSYELIQRAKFVMVYNSSIGLEAALIGKAVLCGGKARYTQYPMVFFPESTRGTCHQVAGIPARRGHPSCRRNSNATHGVFSITSSTGPRSHSRNTSRPGRAWVSCSCKPFSWEQLLPAHSPSHAHPFGWHPATGSRSCCPKAESDSYRTRCITACKRKLSSFPFTCWTTAVPR